MRDIKFRAWDTLGKGFINGFNMIGFSTGQGAPDKKLQRYSQYWREPDSYILEQFTGLKDKNGVEIYEGDIMESYGGAKYEVFWNRGEFMTKRISEIPKKLVGRIKKLSPLTHWNLMQFEVIGNIHQNQELSGDKP